MDEQPNTIMESLGVYHPPQSVSTTEILNGCVNQIRFPLEKISGIKSRRMAGQTEFSIDLAKHAIADCLERSKYNPADIDLLICCNISRFDGPDLFSFEPCTAIKVRKHFGFSNAIVFDITNACAGMFTGIYIADALLKTGAIRRAMVVSGEYITPLTQTAQREIENFMDSRLACLTLGDAGAAVILEKGLDNQTGFQVIDLQTLGQYSPYCIAKAAETGGWIMYTDSVNMADAGIKAGTKYTLDLLRKAGWPPGTFQHLIMHQTSKMTLNSARQEINTLLNSNVLHDSNTINNLEQRGNTASTAHLIAVSDHIHNNNIQSGDKVVFSIAASGLTIGTGLYVFDDLPDRLRRAGSTSDTEARKPARQQLRSDSSSGITLRIQIESVGTIPDGSTKGKDSMELLHSAASNCLEQSSHQCNDIGLLIYSGVYRSEYLLEPAYAALLAGKLDMNASTLDPDGAKTLAFDIFNGALGFLNACYVGQQMITSGKCQTAMVVASEIENNADSFPDKLLGVRETAAAIILDAAPTNDKGFSRFLFRYHEESLDAYTTYCDTREIKPYLHIDKDPDLEALYISCIVPVVQELLAQAGLEPGQIDVVFPPQISTRFIARLSEQLDIALERLVDVVGDGPDLFSASLPYGVAAAYENGLAKPGDTGLIIAVGSGIQVGCAIYHF